VAAGVATVVGCIDPSDPSCLGTIRVDHQNGYVTLYLHLSKRNVKSGQKVKAGDVLGVSGDTGSPGAYHLHFEVRRRIDGSYVPVDPYGWCGDGSDPYATGPGVVNSILWLPASKCSPVR
jgi:murein DD-endopeptidase MepM/ murein hydrolase activator NlpD